MIRAKSNWQATILVCRKCSKKLDGGFGEGGRKPLAKLLRKALGGGKGRKATVGVIDTGCLKLCPKRAVTIVDSRAPGQWLVVRAGTPVEDVVRELDDADRPLVLKTPPAH
jgi:predicted metal-binding protein